MKKHLLLSILSLLPMVVGAAEALIDNIFYVLDADSKTAKVTYSDGSIVYSGNIVIPESVIFQGEAYGVTEIDSYAFMGCSALTSIKWPKNLKSIGRSAFRQCI